MERLAVLVLRHKRTVLAAWVVVCLLGAVLAAGLPGRIVPGGEAPASSSSEVVARRLAGTPLPSLFVSLRAAPGAAPGALDRAVVDVGRDTRAVPGVLDVEPLPPPAVEPPGPVHVVVLQVSTSGGTDGAIRTAHRLQQHASARAQPGVAVFVGGFGAYRDQLTELSRSDLERAERVGLPIVFVVLLLTFGSVWAAALPLVIALSALVAGLGAVGAFATVLPLSDFVTNAASMIGVALGVDYAMFLVQRVRELLHQDLSVEDAVRVAMGRTGTAVLWSGLTVVAGEATLLLVDSRSIRSAAFGMVLVTVFAVATALLVAPVVIALVGHRIGRSRLLTRRAHRRGFWERWARLVTRRGGLWLGGAAVLLVALGVPVGRLPDVVRISGVSTLPAHVPVRQASEAAASRYGPARLSPVLVVLANPTRSDVARARGAIATDPRVVAVQAQPLDAGSTVLAVVARQGPYEEATRRLVASLQSGALRHRLVGLRYDVGGDTAASVDATRGMFGSLPEVGLVLLLVVAGLLLAALRTVFLPLKAVLLVALSLSASLGTLVLLTTTRWGAALLGADGPGDINPIVPVTVVAITVALSTDYEVMLMTRIAEEHQRTGDNLRSIITGVTRTGGVITSAGVIMVAVFLGFALADLTPLKQLGAGLAVAVVLDATVVRGVLVPAAMALMGERNWWWPGRVVPTSAPAPAAPPVRAVAHACV